MSSIINKEDKIWKLFLDYISLIGAEAREVGLDLYGADQKTALAKDLTVAHMLDHISCILKETKEQQALFERAKFHIKPDTATHTFERPREELPKPNAEI